MKVKQHPEDFQVEELTDLAPSQGEHAFYLLEKRGWTTPDAIQAIRRRWRIEGDRIACGGLKDRHAHTRQYLTIWKGPQRGLKQQDLTLRYLGQLPAAYQSSDIRANRFVITIRSLPAEQLPRIEAALAAVKQQGVPSYYDDQRFGSVAAGGEFVARALVQRRFEDALRLALTAPYEHDRGEDRRIKTILKTHWGDWPACQRQLPRSHARELADYLGRHPGDYRGAIARLQPELRGLYLSAYQSHLWNRMLARWLEQQCRADQLVWVPRKLDRVPMHQNLEPEQFERLAALQLPLPSARLHLPEDDPLLPLIQGVLAEEDLELRDLQVKGIRSLFFSKGSRAGLCLPAHFSHQVGPDDQNPGRRLLLRFELPRGAYATLIIKRIVGASPPA